MYSFISLYKTWRTRHELHTTIHSNGRDNVVPIFAWIPVETIVKKHQQDYYAAIAKSDSEANSTAFITFMLQCLKQALAEMQESNQKSNQKSDQKILAAMRLNPSITIRELQDETGLSESGVKKVIRQLRANGFIQRIGGDKGGHWEVK